MIPAANRAPLRQAHFDSTNVFSVSSLFSLSAPESLFDPASVGLVDRAGIAIEAAEKSLPDAAGVDMVAGRVAHSDPLFSTSGHGSNATAPGFKPEAPSLAGPFPNVPGQVCDRCNTPSQQHPIVQKSVDRAR